MDIKKFLLSLMISLCFSLHTVGQSYNQGSLTTITDNLKSFFAHHIFENTYLQFDKPYYAGGDTIYFKAYVTKGEQHLLSDLSGVLHVDFINTENKIDQSIKLRLDSGLCWGDFALPVSLAAGNYRVRAYTRLMLNNGPSEFFDRIISVGSLKENNSPSKLLNKKENPINEKVDFQFFPEGGNLVCKNLSKVGFKAIGSNGLSVEVKGLILDNLNKEVCSFSSTHLGMGYFFLRPDSGKTYHANITFADGTQKIINLPTAAASGVTISVTDESASKVSFMIRANDDYIVSKRNKNFLLLIYSGGKSITYPFKLEARTITLDLQKKLLKTGVNKITLFSENSESLCERLFFVQNNDQLRLQIVSANQNIKREKKSVYC